MCGKAPKTPTVVQRDPVAEQRVAEATAAREVNTNTAALRRRRRASSLLTGAGDLGGAAPLTAMAQAQAKPTLLGGGG